MKRLLFISFLAILSITSAYADGGRGGGRGWGRGGGGGGDWIVPALIGGIIAYDLTYPRTVYTQPYPMYEQPYPVYVQPPPVYAPSVAPAPVQYWYFCAASNAYYPYVSSCQTGWQAVPTTPPR